MKRVAILLMSVLAVGTSLALAAEPVNVVGDGGPLLNWVIVGPFPTEVREDGRGAATLPGYNYDFLTALGGEAKAGLSDGTKAASINKLYNWPCNWYNWGHERECIECLPAVDATVASFG